MTTEQRNKIKKEYYKQIKNLFKPDAIKWLDEMMFQLDMLDRWGLEERIRYDVLVEIRNEVMEEK